jgi:hypothetical protein
VGGVRYEMKEKREEVVEKGRVKEEVVERVREGYRERAESITKLSHPVNYKDSILEKEIYVARGVNPSTNSVHDANKSTSLRRSTDYK